MDKTVLVTPSWSGDLARCEMLVDSVGNFASGFDRHLILIDAQDEGMFRHLADSRTELILKQDLLPDWLRQSSLNRKWWWSFRGLPVRGWILQQVTKLAIAEQYDAAGFCYADSDMMFVRPFDAQSLWHDGRIRFYRDERRPHFYESRRYRNWYGFAAKQFSLGDQNLLDGAYIAQLNCIHKAHAVDMLKAIEDKWQSNWQKTLLRSFDFSEYILYGVYIDECSDKSFHNSTSSSLCRSSWFFDLDDPESTQEFLSTVADDEVALHIQSNLALSTGFVKSLVEGLR